MRRGFANLEEAIIERITEVDGELARNAFTTGNIAP
jgi:hypothetical protein